MSPAPSPGPACACGGACVRVCVCVANSPLGSQLEQGFIFVPSFSGAQGKELGSIPVCPLLDRGLFPTPCCLAGWSRVRALAPGSQRRLCQTELGGEETLADLSCANWGSCGEISLARKEGPGLVVTAGNLGQTPGLYLSTGRAGNL